MELPSKVVYLGGIPFDQSEEQVAEIAKTVGVVNRIQLVIDKETGKSKGYAYIEYPDEQTALSAVRNLSQYSIGNRVLKCNFSTEDAILDPFGTLDGGSGSDKNNGQSIPPLPPGVDVYNEAPGDAITRELQRMDTNRLSNILRDSIKMSKTNPNLMEQLLVRNPQLSYAIVQTCLILGAINDQQLKLLLSSENPLALAPAVEDVPLTQEQKDLIAQVVQLTDLEVNSLPELERKVVFQLKGQYLGVSL